MNPDLHALRLSRIAHELRGSAGVALGATSELIGSVPPEAEKFIAMAHRGVQRVLRIADRLGRASALERNLVEYRRENADLGAFVAGETQKSKEIEHKVPVEVTVAVPDGVITFALDADWLGFSLREIVSNAIQHARQRVSVTLTNDADTLHLVIEDDGPGFRDEIDLGLTSAPNPRRGIGLSLPVCRCVIEDGHGGKLKVGNTAGGGARVEMELPHGAMRAA